MLIFLSFQLSVLRNRLLNKEVECGSISISMPDHVNHVLGFINSTRKVCSLLGGWVSSLILKTYRDVVRTFLF